MGNRCMKSNNNDYQELSGKDESLKTISDNLAYYKKNCIKFLDYVNKFNDYNLIESREEGFVSRQTSENYLLAGCYSLVSKRIEYSDRTVFTTLVNNQEYVFYIMPYPFNFNKISVYDIKKKYF